jgi:exopolyphosphatase/pppGpp-phosphohydrolase
MAVDPSRFRSPLPDLAGHPAVLETCALMAQYEEEPEHVTHVSSLADQLFAGLAPWHEYGSGERLWLHSAALLHDIGWSQTPGGGGHHKHSARLIRAHPWRHFSRREINLVAEIARYHRKALPSMEHVPYKALPAADQRCVDRLAGILRVADALDRTHRRIVSGVEVALGETHLTLRLHGTAPCDAEISMGKRKGNLLEIAAQRRLEIQATLPSPCPANG